MSILPRSFLRDLIQMCMFEDVCLGSNSTCTISWEMTNPSLEHVPLLPQPCSTFNFDEKRVGLVVISAFYLLIILLV